MHASPSSPASYHARLPFLPPVQRQPFSSFYLAAVFVCWWTSGMAYFTSAFLPPQSVLITGVFFALIFGAFLSVGTSNDGAQ